MGRLKGLAGFRFHNCPRPLRTSWNDGSMSGWKQSFPVAKERLADSGIRCCTSRRLNSSSPQLVTAPCGEPHLGLAHAFLHGTRLFRLGEIE